MIKMIKSVQPTIKEERGGKSVQVLPGFEPGSQGSRQEKGRHPDNTYVIHETRTPPLFAGAIWGVAAAMRERERERERERDRETERDRERETETERDWENHEEP